MNGSDIAAIVLLAVAAVEFAALIVLTVLLVRARREAARWRDQSPAQAQLGPRTAAGRAMKAVVETAVRVRDHGVSGLLMSSLEDLTRWATEDRAAIAKVAAPDGTVTIFFSDIEDSTGLNESVGDARWMRVLGAHDELVRRQVERHGGHVVKSQGDGFMVVFGDPVAAAHTALGIQDDLRRPVGSLRRIPIKVRIGMHVGEVVARDGDYFGRNVAMAARVAAQAHGTEILISDDMYEALGEQADDFELRHRDGVELKGLGGAHTLWELHPKVEG